MLLNEKQLGYQDFESFIKNVDVLNGDFKMAFVGGGQGGSKIVSEFIRLGYYGLIYNTCKGDNEYVDNILKGIDPNKKLLNYDVLNLKGFEGAFKNRETGKKAILHNEKLVKSTFVDNQPLKEADFVWIVVALGGGTGNGSLNLISYIVSSLRKNKKFDGQRPTVGIIAAVPESSSFHQIEKNASDAISEIRKLQQKKLVGSCILIDNDKLMNDYINSSANSKKYKEWTVYGNIIVGRIMTEMNGAIMLHGSEKFDKSEILDIWTLPAMLNFGKMKIDRVPTFSKSGKYTLKEEKAYFDKLIDDALTKHNVFADGYDIKYAYNPGVIILKKNNSKILTDRQAQILRDCMRNKIKDSLAQKDHFGIHTLETTGTYKHESQNDEVIIYIMLPFIKLPKRIENMVNSVKEQVAAKEVIMSDYKEVDLLDDMTSFDVIAATTEEDDDFGDLDKLDLSKLGSSDTTLDDDELSSVFKKEEEEEENDDEDLFELPDFDTLDSIIND